MGLVLRAAESGPGEGEEGEGGEEEEGGMVGDDLEGFLTAQVEGVEDGQEKLRGEQKTYRQEEVRRSASYLKMNGSIKIIIVFNFISVIPYP